MNINTRFPFPIRAALAGTMLALSPALPALSPPPPLPVEALTDFYQAMNGDDWHRNDGWLDPEVDVCDWYGITCVTEGEEFGGYEWIGYIRLPDNNLQGSFDLSLIGNLNGSSAVGMPSIELDLSGNAISGELPALPLGIPRLILANNQLEGPLPPQAGHGDGPIIGNPPPAAPVRLEYLDLSGNQFSGVVPEAWQGAMTLDHLDLSDNRLEGSIENAVFAMHPADGEPGEEIRKTELWLADNAFSGELEPDWFENRELNSINLCWTDVEIVDPDLEAWITERHLGGPQAACMGRERLPVDVSMSGSWFNPDRSGEGFSLMLLDNGRPLIYWFSHVFNGRQMWQLSVGQSDDTTLRFHEMLRTRGSFETGLAADRATVRGGSWRLDRVGPDTLHGEQLIAYTGYDLPHSIAITWPPIPDTAMRQDFQRLSRMAGTSCDNQQPHQWISGAWSIPDLHGQGFVVEVLETGRGLVYWFSYTPEAVHNDSPVSASNDWQAWMVGDGSFKDQTLLIDTLYQPQDTQSAAPVDMAGIENFVWGDLTIRFDGENDGHVWYNSNLPLLGSGEFPIERLARPMLADCGG